MVEGPRRNIFNPERKSRTQRKQCGNNDVAGPLQIGTLVLCRSRDDKFHPVEIIERRKMIKSAAAAAEPRDYEYYVHYIDFDRRLDEWVTLERLDLNSLGTGKIPDIEQPDQSGNLMQLAQSESLTQGTTRGMFTRLKRQKIQDKEVKEKSTPGTHKKKNQIQEKELEVCNQGSLVEIGDHGALREREKLTKVKNIGSIVLGRYRMETWYFSPFPAKYNNTPVLYFCEFCLDFVKEKEQFMKHRGNCGFKHPPGNEIYRKGALSVFEVDGMRNKDYCLHLCYLAKSFLDDKSLACDVEYFLFYILCECDDRGCHMVGYFSKEKHSNYFYNLACILILPPYQRKGYGKFLIALSYELSKREGKAGSPEKPLSDLGRSSYLSYWTRTLLPILIKHKKEISIKELSEMTSIWPSDIVDTLEGLNLVQCIDGLEFICTDPNVLNAYLKSAGSGGVPIDVSKLMWTPCEEKNTDTNKKLY